MKCGPCAGNGGDRHSERIVAVDAEINKDYLFTIRDRVRQLNVWRERLADWSEKVELAKSSRSGNEIVGRGGMPQGLDDLLVKWEELHEKYVEILKDCLTMLWRVEEWMEGFTPRQQELIYFRFVKGNNLIKTAEHFGVSTTAIKNWERKIFSGK